MFTTILHILTNLNRSKIELCPLLDDFIFELAVCYFTMHKPYFIRNQIQKEEVFLKSLSLYFHTFSGLKVQCHIPNQQSNYSQQVQNIQAQHEDIIPNRHLTKTINDSHNK